jgi:hypothetical protein
MDFASPYVRASYRSGDPNGIRTRVTPVKGECPRPLDDRVFCGVLWLHQVESAQAENVNLARSSSGIANTRPQRFA